MQEDFDPQWFPLETANVNTENEKLNPVASGDVRRSIHLRIEWHFLFEIERLATEFTGFPSRTKNGVRRESF